MTLANALKTLAAKFNKPVDRKPNSRRTHLEIAPLEERRVMSTYLSGSTLVIDGTAGADVAYVGQSSWGGTSNITFAVNGQWGAYPSSSVSSIRFSGFGGNDYFSNSAAMPSTAYGGYGNDTLIGGSAADTLSGEQDHDSLVGGAANDNLIGGDGNDTTFAGPGNDTLYGGNGNDNLNGEGDNDFLAGWYGNDTLDGGSGYDTLTGEQDHDSLIGGSENDALIGGDGNDIEAGGDGNDTLYGGNGNDVLRGEGHGDYLYGWYGDDTLEGGSHDDYLYGEQDNDVLRGGDGWDVLHGGDGNDGLFGGLGQNILSGGAHADRFLAWDQAFASIADLEGQDALIPFVRGNDETLEGNRYLAKSWTEAEIIRVDGALAKLHARTGSTTLLKEVNGDRMTFARLTGVGGSVLGWNSSGDIKLPDEAFADSEIGFQRTVLHEIGHNWEEESPIWNTFQSLSGWTKNNPNSSSFTMTESYGEVWWFRTASEFSSNYARAHPVEDFAEAFAETILGTNSLIPKKSALINSWLDNV